MVVRFAKNLICLSGIFSLCANGAEKQTPYQDSPYYDSVLSNESIGSIVSTPYHLLYHTLDDTKEDAAPSSAFEVGKRIGKMFFLELPLISYAKFYQHEFGHGFRARDFGHSVDYEFGLPYPYRLFTKNHDSYPARTIVRGRLETFEGSVVGIGGLEAELILSQLLLNNAAKSGGIDRPILNLYFFLKTSTLLYGSTKENESDSDVKNASWAEDVKTKALVSLLDPVLLSAITANFDYLRNGNYSNSIPWFDLRELRLLPSLAYYLIPYGESYEAQVLASFKENLVHMNVADWRFVDPIDKNGKGTRGKFLRLRLLRELPSLRLAPSLDASFSKQPYFESSSWTEVSNVWFVGLGTKFKFENSFSLIASIGRKNKGYLPQTTINAGTIYSVGASFPAF
jgi:hypothetical protein